MFTSDNYHTISNLWLYQKQSYSVSKDFLKNTLGKYIKKENYAPLLDSIKHNSNFIPNSTIYLTCITPKIPISEHYFVVKDPPDIDWEADKPDDLDYQTLFTEKILDFYNNRQKLEATE